MPDFSDPGLLLSEPAVRLKMLPHPSPLNPVSVIRAVWKQKLLIAILWIAVTAVVAAVGYSLPQIYRSEAVILIESQRIPERFVATTVNEDLQGRLNTISQTILSYSKLLEIINRFDLYREERKTLVQEEIIERMRGDIQISPVREWGQRKVTDSPGAFRVSYLGSNPAVVAQVTTQLANLFIDENLRTRELQAIGTSEFLDNQLADAKRKLDEQEQVLSGYKRRYNGELPQQENALIANLARLQSQLSSVQDSLNRTEQNRIMLSNALDAAQASEAALARIVEEVSSPRAENVSRVAAARSRADLLAEQLETLRRQYTDEHPDVRRLKAELAALQKAPEKEPAPAPAPVATPPPPVRPEMAQALLRERERVEAIRSQLNAAQREIQLLNAERADVTKQLQGLQGRIEQLPLREQELASLMRDYEISKANYRSLLDKKLSAEMAAEMEKRQKAERFSILDAARVPEKPIKPDRRLIALTGCAAGLMLGMMVGLGRESKSNAILGEWELPEGIPVLGRVPRLEVALNGTHRKRRRRVRLLLLAFAAFLVLLACAAAGFYFLRG